MFTDNQIAALKYLVIVSRVGTDRTKSLLLFLIDQSKGLTEEVCLSLVEGREGYDAEEIREIAHGVDGMMSANCSTHIHEVLVAMGSNLLPSLHYGDFEPDRDGDKFNTDGQFAGFPPSMVGGVDREPGLVAEGMPLRYTFWLCKEHYSRAARYVATSRTELEQIDLKRPELKYHS